MKVLNVAKEDFGGAGLATLLIHKELNSKGFESSLLVKKKTVNDNSIIEWGESGIVDRLYSLYIGLIKRIAKNFLNDQFLFFSLFEKKRNNNIDKLRELSKKYDVILIHWIAGFFSLEEISSALRGNERCKVYIVPMDMAHLTGGCHFGQSCKEFKQSCHTCPATNNTYISKKIRKVNSDKARSIFELNVESLSFCDFINERCVESSQPIYKYHKFRLPIDYNRFNISPKHEGFTIFVGSYNPEDERKGNDHFILCLFELIALMRKSSESTNISLLYPKGTKLSLPNISNVKIKFYEYAKSDEEMAKIYNMANVFVNNSMDDFGPVTLLQSLFCGVPVVSHDLGYASSFIKNGLNGYLVDNNDYKAFAESLYRIYKGELNSDAESIRNAAICNHLNSDSICDVLLNARV
ncbi:hypothetical protein AKJ18_04690 [Vibrio xuii]|nr:hypothetical protein AKJ18_04690 [Vibrio xuii]